MKPYSIDFRQKIIDVRKRENISIRKLAERFNIAKSFVQKLLKQERETGDISPKPQGGSPPPKLNSEQLVILVEIMESNNDATLEELCDLLLEKTAIRISKSTIVLNNSRVGLYFQKKRYMQQKKNEKTYKKKG